MEKTKIILPVVIIRLSIVSTALPLSVGTQIWKAADVVVASEDIETPRLAPLSPPFTYYFADTADEFYGYIPPPVDLSHLAQLPVERLQMSNALPGKFDWRDSGVVTSVKDQNPCGTCWIFGTTSVLESAVLLNEGAEYDFSEQNVALCVDRSWIYLYNDFSDPCQGGGWSWLAAENFIKKGAVLESCKPYRPSALRCDGSCLCGDCPSIKNVNGYRLVTNEGSQIDVIKNAVYDHGPVTVSFCYDWSWQYSVDPWGTIHDYYPCDESPNHCVSIIGWDDMVPHPNPNHGGTGAWIVKNSWGPSCGNGGFFYLTYNSSSAKEVAYLTYKDQLPGEEFLYWDEAGLVNSVGYGDTSAWMASVFSPDQSGNLTHVDFWTTSNNAQYEIHVWNGFFGSELARQSGSCQEYGYYSIPLSTPISIEAGQQFTIGIKMTTPGYNYPLPTEYQIFNFVEPPIQSNVTFVRHTSGDPWEDMAGEGWNACLRVRMLSRVSEPDIWVEPSGFNKTLPSGSIFSTNLTIRNDGDGILTFEIIDTEESDGRGSQEPATVTEFCGETLQERTKDIEVTSNVAGSIRNLTEASGEYEIAYDDGEVDTSYTWSGPGAAYGVHFTSPTCSSLAMIRSYIVADPVTFDWKVLSWTGSAPGSSIASGTTTSDSTGWHDVYVGGISIPSDFVVAIYWKEEWKPYLGCDLDTPIDNRSWGYNSRAWSIRADRDCMIRAIVSTEEEGWLSVAPSNGTMAPMNQTNVTVMINTTGLFPDSYEANIAITSNDPDENPVIIPVHLTVSSPSPGLDTGPGAYPSISGVHTGTITMNHSISARKLYTYPCAGTGGHTEYVHIWGNGIDRNASWNGYSGDWHNLTFGVPLRLEKGKTYNYEITTGSYPQIVHAPSKPVIGGNISCNTFVDVNGNLYTDWIPAIRLE